MIPQLPAASQTDCDAFLLMTELPQETLKEIIFNAV